jgi:hypothetical protein
MHLLLIKHAIHLTAVYETPICGAIAILKGGKPERIGAAVFIGAILLTDLFFAVGAHGAVSTAVTATFKSGYADPTTAANIDLVSTLLLSCFFLYLAIRYGSLWLAAAMIIQASELYFARLYIDSGFSTFPIYAIELNAICVLVLFTLAGAALSSWRMRVVKRREEARRAELTERRRVEQERRFQAMFERRAPPPPLAPASPRGAARFIIEPPPI